MTYATKVNIISRNDEKKAILDFLSYTLYTDYWLLYCSHVFLIYMNVFLLTKVEQMWFLWSVYSYYKFGLYRKTEDYYGVNFIM